VEEKAESGNAEKLKGGVGGQRTEDGGQRADPPSMLYGVTGVGGRRGGWRVLKKLKS
jgi:hypothetical protein